MEGTASWWMSIAAIPVVAVAWASVSVFISPDPVDTLVAYAPFMVVGSILMIVSPYAVYRERTRLKDTAAWSPSRWYYLIPVVFPLSMMYIIQRYRYIGLQ